MEGETPPVKENVSSFIEKVTKADGELILLPAKISKLGEPFFISVRHGVDKVQPELRYLIVDVFAKRGEGFIPVGIYDWEISGEKAVGNKQRHGHLASLNQAHEAADKYWATGEAFHVIDMDFLKFALESGGFETMDELRGLGIVKSPEQWVELIYQGEGLGSLMIAVSVLALHRQGIKTMDLGRLSPPAKRTWESFDRGERRTISTQELVIHPKITQAIEKFAV